MTRLANRTEGLRFRIVLGPNIAIGPGKADLLLAIDETASLTSAAKRFDMSYKRAWSLVQEMNDAFAKPLVETEKGGAGGGGHASLTRLGRRILNRYREMERDASKAVAAGVADMRAHLKQKPLARKPRTTKTAARRK